MVFPLILALHSVLSASSEAPFYLGTYTTDAGSKGIYRVILNTETGALSQPTLAAETSNPSFICFDSTGKYLYAVDETEQGKVNGFAVADSGELKLINSVFSLGGAPCYISVPPGDKCVLVANYSGGNVVSMTRAADGSLAPVGQNFQNKGNGPNADRQERPHMHSVQVDNAKRFCVACDLGTDEVLLFPFDTVKGEPKLSDPVREKAPAGAGPRHFDFSKDEKFLYVANELQSSVSVYAVDSKHGEINRVQVISALPEGTSLNGVTASEIFCHPNGKWLYMSIRGLDGIASFEIQADGRLKVNEFKKSPVNFPRGFAIDPSGHWIVVGGQKSNDVVSLKIDQASGKLGDAIGKVQVGSPVSVLFTKK